MMPYKMPSTGLMATASRVSNPSVFGTSNDADSAPELATNDDTAYEVPAAFSAITNGPPPEQIGGCVASQLVAPPLNAAAASSVPAAQEVHVSALLSWK
jgi:hypothetical protein